MIEVSLLAVALVIVSAGCLKLTHRVDTLEQRIADLERNPLSKVDWNSERIAAASNAASGQGNAPRTS